MTHCTCLCQLPGRELLHAQGLQYSENILDGITENQKTDLAGNA